MRVGKPCAKCKRHGVDCFHSSDYACQEFVPMEIRNATCDDCERYTKNGGKRYPDGGLSTCAGAGKPCGDFNLARNRMPGTPAAEKTPEIKPGDLVRLKSGGPRMTAATQIGSTDIWRCQWFTDGALLVGEFPAASLIPFEAQKVTLSTPPDDGLDDLMRVLREMSKPSPMKWIGEPKLPINPYYGVTW